MPAHSGYERIQDLSVRTPDTDAPSSNPFNRLSSWWDQLQFWSQITIGGSIGFVTAVLLTIIIMVLDDQASYADRFVRTLPSVPEGCLGPPFVLISFHGGQGKHALNLMTGRYNNILKYTRDGCLLGQAAEGVNPNGQPIRRLRGLRVFGDKLMAVDMGTSAADNVGNLVEFGSCGTADKMVKRPVLRWHVLQSDGSDTECRKHMFDVDSPDQGATLYISDQNSGAVLRYNGSTGKALGSVWPTGTADDTCAGLVADWRSPDASPGLGLRGICMDGADRLLMPYDTIQDGTNNSDVSGVFAIDPLPSQTASNTSSADTYWISAVKGADYREGISVEQTPDSSSSSRLEVFTEPFFKVYAGNIVVNLSSFPAWPNASQCATAADNKPDYRKSIEFLCGESDKFGFAVHKPSSCQMSGHKLYFNSRQSDSMSAATGLFTANGVVELDLQTNKTRVFIDPSVGFTQGFLINQGVLYVLTRRANGGGKVETRRRALSWKSKAQDAPKRGDLVRFNITTGQFLGGVVSGTELSGQFPDQPVQMSWSMC